MGKYTYKTSYSLKDNGDGAEGELSVKTNDGIDFTKSAKAENIDELKDALFDAFKTFYKDIESKPELDKCDCANCGACDKCHDDKSWDSFWDEDDESDNLDYIDELEDRLYSLKIDYDILNKRVEDLQEENTRLSKDNADLQKKLKEVRAKQPKAYADDFYDEFVKMLKRL